MSNALGIDFAADQEEIERDRETEIKFRGRTIPAVVSVPMRTREFEDDTTGYYRTATLRVSVRNSVIPSHGASKVKEGELIIYDNVSYRVATTTNDSVMGVTLMDCESEAQ